MKMIRIMAFAAMLVSSANINAQKLILKIDSLLRDRYYNVKIDTDYLQRPSQRWNIRVGSNISSSGLEAIQRKDGHEYKLEVNADRKMTTQVKLSYSGIALSLSINPANFSGKNTDWGLNFNTSGRRMGLDVTASQSKTMKGFVNYDGDRSDLNTGDIKQLQVYATGYYAFNSRRFAYGAAFSQSYIQKRSAGSWLLSAALYGSRIRTDERLQRDSRLNHFDIALGGGYGYNWVPAKGWLFHLSGTPTLCLYSHDSMRQDGEYEKLDMHFPEFIIIGKGGIVYETKKWFFGSNMIYYTTVSGDKSTLQVLNTRWNARCYIGFRF